MYHGIPIALMLTIVCSVHAADKTKEFGWDQVQTVNLPEINPKLSEERRKSGQKLASFRVFPKGSRFKGLAKIIKVEKKGERWIVTAQRSLTHSEQRRNKASLDAINAPDARIVRELRKIRGVEEAGHRSSRQGFITWIAIDAPLGDKDEPRVVSGRIDSATWDDKAITLNLDGKSVAFSKHDGT